MTRVDGASPAAAAERRARKAQAAAENAKTGDTITWKGETFRLEPGEMPGAAVMLLNQMAAADMSSLDPESNDVARQVLEMCLAQPSGIPPGEQGFDLAKYEPGEYKRFMRHFAKTRATVAEVMEGPLQDIVEIMAARPTNPPPGSSNGRPQISANSTATSSDAPDEV